MSVMVEGSGTGIGEESAYSGRSAELGSTPGFTANVSYPIQYGGEVADVVPSIATRVESTASRIIFHVAHASGCIVPWP